MHLRTFVVTSACLLFTVASSSVIAQTNDPLPSWNDGPTRNAIIDFVASVATEGSEDFVAVEDRLAVLDIDGTLWAERPYYADALFAADRVAALAPDNPDWAHALPFNAIVNGDYGVLSHIATVDFVRMMHAAGDGLTDDEFQAVVADWFVTAENELFERPQADLTYQPMMELIDLLEANDFAIYLVTGANEEFIRAISEDIFGVPRERVIGAGLEIVVEEDENGITVSRAPASGTESWGNSKVAEIVEVAGRRPIFGAGNSDGDYAMMRWATTGPGMSIVIVHDDEERELAYGRAPRSYEAVESLDSWYAVSVANDWETVFSEE